MMKIKGTATIGFDGGSLSINIAGFGAKNGAGILHLDEDAVTHLRDAKQDCYYEFCLSPSDMMKLAEFFACNMPLSIKPDPED